MLYGWPFMYWPAHSVTTSYGEIDLLGLNGPDWVAPPPRIDEREESAVCRIGFMLIWQAEVRWSDDGTPNLKKYPKLEVKGDEQPLLFGKPNETTQPSGLRDNAESLDPAELPLGDYSEGAVQQIIVNAYERDQGARDACLAHYGTACAVCRFSFFEKYGQIGEGFVHVHHVKPLSEIGESYRVDPVKDLRPVCPNCHAMLHRLTPCLTIEQLKALLHM
jgi:HNH endonuclease